MTTLQEHLAGLPGGWRRPASRMLRIQPCLERLAQPVNLNDRLRFVVVDNRVKTLLQVPLRSSEVEAQHGVR